MIVDEGVHDVLVVEAPARFNDVLEEEFVRVLFARLLLKVRADHERAAPADRGRSAREGHLFENQHLEALFGRMRGRGETRAARSHDDHVVGFVEFDGTVRGERHRGRGGERGGTRKRTLQKVAAIGHMSLLWRLERAPAVSQTPCGPAEKGRARRRVTRRRKASEENG